MKIRTVTLLLSVILLSTFATIPICAEEDDEDTHYLGIGLHTGYGQLFSGLGVAIGSSGTEVNAETIGIIRTDFTFGVGVFDTLPGFNIALRQAYLIGGETADSMEKAEVQWGLNIILPKGAKTTSCISALL